MGVLWQLLFPDPYDTLCIGVFSFRRFVPEILVTLAWHLHHISGVCKHSVRISLAFELPVPRVLWLKLIH